MPKKSPKNFESKYLDKVSICGVKSDKIKRKLEKIKGRSI